jgi:cytochrome c oxidase subunit 2
MFMRKIDVPACVPYSASFLKSHVKQTDTSTYEVYIVARMWGFDPDEITIKKGSAVDFYLTSADVVHGFEIPRKAVNLMAVPGGVNRTTVTFNDYGVYPIICHEYCGTGHQNMMGKIIVK